MQLEQPSPNEPPQKANKYGKRPLWQWVILYVILAVIVYGVIYLVFFHHGSSGGGSSYHY